MSSGTAYDFRVRSLAEQLFILQAVEELVIPNETPEQSAIIVGIIGRLEAVIGRRPPGAVPKSPYKNRKNWRRNRNAARSGAAQRRKRDGDAVT